MISSVMVLEPSVVSVPAIWYEVHSPRMLENSWAVSTGVPAKRPAAVDALRAGHSRCQGVVQQAHLIPRRD